MGKGGFDGGMGGVWRMRVRGRGRERGRGDD